MSKTAPKTDTRPAWLRNWLERHQHPVSFWLHMLGIPLAVAGAILGLIQIIAAFSDPAQWSLWWRPVGLIFVGYLLQWIGHRIEGNDVGELIPIKKALGMPYVAVSPRYRQGE
jgi:predicted membrane channel-forming protein YqfA (hemolysin III family)